MRTDRDPRERPGGDPRIKKFSANTPGTLRSVPPSPSRTPHGRRGAIETIICALALQHQEIPMTLNINEPDPECDLDYVVGIEALSIKIAVNLNCGFGGKNSCLVLGRYPPEK